MCHALFVKSRLEAIRLEAIARLEAITTSNEQDPCRFHELSRNCPDSRQFFFKSAFCPVSVRRTKSGDSLRKGKPPKKGDQKHITGLPCRLDGLIGAERNTKNSILLIL